MMQTVREIRESDIDRLIRYWMDSPPAFLEGMGVDLSKLPSEEQWRNMLGAQLSQPYDAKQSYAVIWELDGEPVGHSNVNKIVFGQEAYMHLHLWHSTDRKRGLGTEFVRLSLPWFFNNMKLQTLYCEPYALNPAPNRTLPLAGFQWVKNYRTTPGWINFEQEVSLYSMTRAQWDDSVSR